VYYNEEAIIFQHCIRQDQNIDKLIRKEIKSYPNDDWNKRSLEDNYTLLEIKVFLELRLEFLRRETLQIQN
jgi:hypothetical protein